MEAIAKPLFEGELIRLSPFDPEKDAETEADWYADPALLALVEREPVRPLTTAAVKNVHAEEEKDRRAFVAAIRTRDDDRLVGRASLKHIDHAMGNGLVSVIIGNARDRNRGYGTGALRLLLRYAFDELGLFRLGAEAFEYHTGALRWLERAGFTLEVRQRQALYRAGKYWDILSFGILRDEWKGQSEARHV